MKKVKLIFVLPVVIGIALIIVGIVTSSTALLYAGIGVLFGGSFAVAAIVTVVAVVKAVKSSGTDDAQNAVDTADVDDVFESETDGRDDSDSDKILDRKREELEEIDGMPEALKKVKNTVANPYKHTRSRYKFLSCLFVFCFIGFAVVGMILLSFGFIVPGVAVFSCSFLLVFGAIVISKIKEKLSGSKTEELFRRADGIVKSCDSICDGEDGGDPVYHIQIDVDGEIYSEYALRSYETGSRVPVNIMCGISSRIVRIINDDISDGDDDGDAYCDDRETVDDFSGGKDLNRNTPSERKIAPRQERNNVTRNNTDAELFADLQQKNDATERDIPVAVDVGDIIEETKENDTDAASLAQTGSTDTVSTLSNERRPTVGYRGINRKK